MLLLSDASDGRTSRHRAVGCHPGPDPVGDDHQADRHVGTYLACVCVLAPRLGRIGAAGTPAAISCIAAVDDLRVSQVTRAVASSAFPISYRFRYRFRRNR